MIPAANDSSGEKPSIFGHTVRMRTVGNAQRSTLTHMDVYVGACEIVPLFNAGLSQDSTASAKTRRVSAAASRIQLWRRT
jgi:hypothetical protein